MNKQFSIGCTVQLRKDSVFKYSPSAAKRAGRKTFRTATIVALLPSLGEGAVKVGRGLADGAVYWNTEDLELVDRLFLVEFYTRNPKTGESGWDINFAWVHAVDSAAAEQTLKDRQGTRFGEVITCEEHAEIIPLKGLQANTPKANLFIY